LALVCGIALENAGAALSALIQSPSALAVIGGYAAYHAGLLAWHHATAMSMAAVGVTSLAGAGAGLAARQWLHRWNGRAGDRHRSRDVAVLVMAAWAAVNGFYLADWATHLTYTQRDASRWLAATLPRDTILIGDVAPGLCLYNRLPAVPVMPGLCNDHGPVEQFAGRPRAIAILDGPDKESWWTLYYPRLVSPERRIALFPKVAGFSVGVYRVPDRY
jgi:hypothetical protein